MKCEWKFGEPLVATARRRRQAQSCRPFRTTNSLRGPPRDATACGASPQRRAVGQPFQADECRGKAGSKAWPTWNGSACSATI